MGGGTEQRKRTENLETTSRKYSQLIFDKCAKTFKGRKDRAFLYCWYFVFVFLANDARAAGHS